MQLNVGDRLDMKTQHPCGGNVFTLLRVGMDFRIRCETCGREVMAPRKKIEKNIRRVIGDSHV